ncbi:hypothetical protein BGW38_004275, partial [Lunasporangiospora selenospora]
PQTTPVTRVSPQDENPALNHLEIVPDIIRVVAAKRDVQTHPDGHPEPRLRRRDPLAANKPTTKASSRRPRYRTREERAYVGFGVYAYQWKKINNESVFSSLGQFLGLGHGSGSSGGLTTERWTPILLTNITRVSDQTSLFEFELPKPCKIPISSVIYVKDDEIQAMRAYTPVHSTDSEEQEKVQLLIKRYHEGQVSRFMHSAKVGQKIEMRGPVSIWPGEPSDLEQWDEIGMVAGGTGITAFLPIIHAALTRSTKQVKLSLLFAAQSPEELYFKDELDQLAKSYPNQLRVAYTVDRVSTGSGSPPNTQLDNEWDGNVGFINHDMLKGLLPIPVQKAIDQADDIPTEPSSKSIVLVCGPENMVTHVSGSRGISGQDPIRGILGSMGYKKSQVYRFPN